jgi:ketosteroid isomerase-like protein
MADQSIREHARNPQDLERLLVARQWAGDVDAMVALYEADAVIDSSDGRLIRGRQAIRKYFADYNASGRKFLSGVQRPALVAGDLALTSTRLADGTVTGEVARRQPDGTWLWVLDRFSMAREAE